MALTDIDIPFVWQCDADAYGAGLGAAALCVAGVALGGLATRYRNLVQRSCQETADRDLVQGSCFKISLDLFNKDLAKRPFVEILQRDPGLRSLAKVLPRTLLQRHCRKSSLRQQSYIEIFRGDPE